MRRALLVLLLVLTACTAPQTPVNGSNDTVENVTRNQTVTNEILNESVVNESVVNEPSGEETESMRKEFSVVEDEFFKIKMRDEVFEGRFDGMSDGKAFFEIDNETVILEENESVDVIGWNLSLNSAEPDAVIRGVGSEVSFWLGGARLTLEEGASRSYGPYNVTVMFIGEGDDGRGEAMFRVNGESTKALSEDETEYFDNSFIMVRDVYYRQGVRQIKRDRVNLSVR